MTNYELGRHFMEAASEKRGRGRPRVFPQKTEDLVAAMEFRTKIKTRRGNQNYVYRQIAASRLRTILLTRADLAAQFRWLLDVETGELYKPSILTALGRIRDPKLFVELAVQVCRQKPRTKEAEALIRSAASTSDVDIKRHNADGESFARPTVRLR